MTEVIVYQLRKLEEDAILAYTYWNFNSIYRINKSDLTFIDYDFNNTTARYWVDKNLLNDSTLYCYLVFT